MKKLSQMRFRGESSRGPALGAGGLAQVFCSRQTAWQNLRGGAAYMVGNALVMLAASVGPAVTLVWWEFAIPLGVV